MAWGASALDMEAIGQPEEPQKGSVLESPLLNLPSPTRSSRARVGLAPQASDSDAADGQLSKSPLSPRSSPPLPVEEAAEGGAARRAPGVPRVIGVIGKAESGRCGWHQEERHAAGRQAGAGDPSAATGPWQASACEDSLDPSDALELLAAQAALATARSETSALWRALRQEADPETVARLRQQDALARARAELEAERRAVEALWDAARAALDQRTFSNVCGAYGGCHEAGEAAPKLPLQVKRRLFEEGGQRQPTPPPSARVGTPRRASLPLAGPSDAAPEAAASTPRKASCGDATADGAKERPAPGSVLKRITQLQAASPRPARPALAASPASRWPRSTLPPRAPCGAQQAASPDVPALPLAGACEEPVSTPSPPKASVRERIQRLENSGSRGQLHGSGSRGQLNAGSGGQLIN